jgi:putative endonuclease
MTRGERGKWGEEQAARLLLERGYTLLGQNVRSRFGEVDIIAGKGEIAAFVEVKLRGTRTIAAAREFVDARKQKKIRNMASMWLAKQQKEWQVRFDVVEISASDDDPPEIVRIEHLEGAFE